MLRKFLILFIQVVAVIVAVGVSVESVFLYLRPWSEASQVEARYAPDYFVIPLSAGFHGKTITAVSYALLPKKLGFPTALFVQKPKGEDIAAVTDMSGFWIFLGFFLTGWYVVFSFTRKGINRLRKVSNRGHR
jgi:hypothetical protein